MAWNLWSVYQLLPGVSCRPTTAFYHLLHAFFVVPSPRCLLPTARCLLLFEKARLPCYGYSSPSLSQVTPL